MSVNEFLLTLNFQCQYPTSLVSRCFAFEPAENQADDTKGIIMIPNVGQLGFYMNTMISDMASEMLLSFGTLVRNSFYLAISLY